MMTDMYQSCQFIAGDILDDQHKCGAPVAPGQVYCPEHYALCVIRPAQPLADHIQDMAMSALVLEAADAFCQIASQIETDIPTEKECDHG